MDWLVPPADFYARSHVTTRLAVGLLLCAGFIAAWRTGSVRAGAFAGFASTTMAALISLVGASVLLALWHDPVTIAAVDGSGGLAEVFVLSSAVEAAHAANAGGLDVLAVDDAGARLGLHDSADVERTARQRRVPKLVVKGGRVVRQHRLSIRYRTGGGIVPRDPGAPPGARRR